MNAHFDPRSGTLAASETQLRLLAAALDGDPPAGDARAVLVAAGLLRPDGRLHEALVPVARTVASPVAEVRLRRMAWGQATRIRVYGLVPIPAETCSRIWAPHCEGPLTRERSRPQLVTSAP